MRPIIALLAALVLTSVANGADTDRYRSPGKRMAPVQLDNSGFFKARVGETLSVPLRFTTTAPSDAIRVEISAAGALLLDQPLIEVQLDGGPAGVFELPVVSVTPLANGRHALNVTVFMQLTHGQRFRSFSLPVEVGDAQNARSKPASVRVDHDGAAIHVLPAREN